MVLEQHEAPAIARRGPLQHLLITVGVAESVSSMPMTTIIMMTTSGIAISTTISMGTHYGWRWLRMNACSAVACGRDTGNVAL